MRNNPLLSEDRGSLCFAPPGECVGSGGGPRVRIAFRRRACAFLATLEGRDEAEMYVIPPVYSKSSLENEVPSLQEVRLSGKVLPTTAVN